MQSQLSHGNPAYRCRHGHTSAHTAAMRQTRNLYLREDVILGRVFAQLHTITSGDAGIAAEIVRHQQDRNVTNLIRFQRTHNITIESCFTGLVLEPDHEKSIIVRSPAGGSAREASIPRQRIHRARHRQ